MTPQELKNSILQQAIQGKLVEQRPEEGTAEELFQQIQKEKQRLIAEGKIKKEKPLPEITEDEKPFDIPESWKWVRLGDLVNIYTGKKDANFGSAIGEYDFFTCSAVPIKCESFSYEGEYLIMPGNGANIGIVTYYNGKFEAYQRTYLLENIFATYLKYLKYHLEYNWKKYNADKMYGSAIPFIKLGNLQNYLVAFPPLAEQKRIVAKIEELLPYIHRYEESWLKLEALNSRFPDDMKKSLLQYAIQGKLVEQRPEEGTAEELFERIQEEKQRLIADGKIKKEKPLPEITEEEKPFDIPESWKWCYIGDIFLHNTGKAQNSTGSTKGVMRKFITTSNLYWNRFDFSKVKEMPFTEQELVRCTVKKGDLLVCEGGDCGRSAIWCYDEEVCIQNHVHRLRPYVEISIEYFYYLFYIYKFTGKLNGRGVGIQGLSNEAIHKVMLPLPPLAEQKRIVAKLEELLLLCENLIKPGQEKECRV